MTALQRACSTVRRTALVVAGFTSIAVAVFQLAGSWGWLAIGVSLFALDLLTDHTDDAEAVTR